MKYEFGGGVHNALCSELKQLLDPEFEEAWIQGELLLKLHSEFSFINIGIKDWGLGYEK